MLPQWTWIIGFIIGASVGSFLNVVIYRLPRGLSIHQPKNSFCPSCKKQLSWGEMIPLVSWAVQGGKCAGCKEKIPTRYFVVELINGTLWGWIWYLHLVVSAAPDAYLQADVVKAVGFALFASALVVAIFTDLAHYIIPDEVNGFMFVVGVGMNVAYFVMGKPEAWYWGMPSSIAGALVGIGALWGIAFLGRVAFGKDAMGHGDIKMARGIGAVLLPLSAGISFALAVVLGAVLGILMIVLRKKPAEEAEIEQGAGEEEEWEPESIGSLVKSLFGYLLLMDLVGLFIPSVYMWWFGEDPSETEVVDEDFEVEPTMIPFGPYLAGGALLAILFSGPLTKFVLDYWADVTSL